MVDLACFATQNIRYIDFKDIFSSSMSVSPTPLFCFSDIVKALVFLFFAFVAVLAGQESPYLSLADIEVSDGGRMYVTARTGRSVLELDAATGAQLREICFPVELSGAVLSGDGATLYVTGGVSTGQVFVVDTATAKVEYAIELGHSPNAPVLSPDECRLYVCNQFDGDVSIIDLEMEKELARVPVVREPVAADISHDGRWLFVANLIPQGRADVDYIASEISVIDTETQTVRSIPLVNGAEGVRGLKLSPDGKYVFATHIMARYQVPTTQLERGWVATNALSVIRVEDQTLQYTVLLDDLTLGFPNPWAIDFSADGSTLLVSAAGSHELSVIDLELLLNKVGKQAAGSGQPVYLDAHNDLTFLSGLRKRVSLQGNGPRAMIVQGDRVYVAHYFSDSIDVLDLGPMDASLAETYELNPNVVVTAERLGEQYFHDGALCFQQWLSCSTCHPDARTDALNWDLLNDGIGNPKNVKSMLHAHRTPRTTWLGVRANAEVSVRSGIKHIQFAVRPESDAEALDAYLKSLEPLPSPYLVDGELSESALRGKRLFETQRCSRCHVGELLTDMEVHHVGTTRGVDAGKPVDTPSLIEVWRTAPYLHDGRAATIWDVLTQESHAEISKRTERLSESELRDLEAYLLSL